MCLAVLHLSDADPQRVILVANRDEFHARPTAPLARWPDSPIIGGRDLEAGGTWLAISPDHRFGLLTNLRGFPIPDSAPSRGGLIPAFLAGTLSARDFMETLRPTCHQYAGYNLVLGDSTGVWLHSNQGDTPMLRLDAGYHGIGNGAYSRPWPKVTAGVAALRRHLERRSPTDRLWETLLDRRVWPDHLLPETGLPLEIERPLSAAFIVQPRYGTRSTTVCAIDPSAGSWIEEIRYDPDGRPSGRTRLSIG